MICNSWNLISLQNLQEQINPVPRGKRGTPVGVSKGLSGVEGGHRLVGITASIGGLHRLKQYHPHIKTTRIGFWNSVIVTSIFNQMSGENMFFFPFSLYVQESICIAQLWA